MDGGRAALLQCGLDETTHDADALDDGAGDSRGDCVDDHELRNDATEFPPLDGTLPPAGSRLRSNAEELRITLSTLVSRASPVVAQGLQPGALNHCLRFGGTDIGEKGACCIRVPRRRCNACGEYGHPL